MRVSDATCSSLQAVYSLPLISGFKDKGMSEVPVAPEHMQQEWGLKNLEAKSETTIVIFLIKGNLTTEMEYIRIGKIELCICK